jgi:hypothetical protein
MRLFVVACLLSLLIGSSVSSYVERAPWPDSPFDQYGEIRWDDEKARLDNFAIQITNYPKSVGAILVLDRTGGCPGEAMARAIRAKRYVVEHRGVPWNRVLWRREGYFPDVRTTLLMVPEGARLRYPFYEPSGEQVDGPATRACRSKLERIRRSRW